MTQVASTLNPPSPPETTSTIQPMIPPKPPASTFSPEPTHPNLIRVHRGNLPFSSRATSLVSLPPGALFTTLHPYATHTQTADYTTIQDSASTHILLNSDLVYCNHSCDPSLVFDMERWEVRVVEHRELKEGDELNFFYPSSEWEMRQPFECQCQATGKTCPNQSEDSIQAVADVADGKQADVTSLELNGHGQENHGAAEKPDWKCLGLIAGAKYLEDDVLKKYWLNQHILELMEQRRAN